ncbi:Ig-like domain-containing protein, partial [Draconibacterium sp.]|nr:Ig-like domain-containing protein [Draconibacterium sp.]
MKIKGKIPLLIVAVLAWIVVISSCANQGMPTGGPRDSVPPILLETDPGYKELNYKGDKVQFTFNEYIIPDEVSEALVISPPLEKRPIIRTKGKSLVIQFNEDLRDSTTYSLDFKNSIADNNEKNPYKGLRFSFSTGDVYDSLRVAGKVMNAFNLEPSESALVLLQKNLHDSAVYKVRPEYIAETDEAGLFMVDNIAPGTYNVFSVNDANSDLLYNEGAEDIAFVDTLIIPSAHFHEELDTLVKGVDSLLVLGHTHFFPEPLYLRQFTEDIFDQYLDSYSRDTRYQCSFVFNESVKDTFDVNLVGIENKDWYLLEPNEELDSLVLWIADTTVARLDTLLMEVSYYQLDSMARMFVYKDTLEMNFKDKVEKESKRKRLFKKEDEEEKPEPIPQFNWRSNISTTFDVNKDILLTAPEPVSSFDSTGILLYLVEDTLKTPLKFTFRKDTSEYRTFRLTYKWEYDTEYMFEIDSAACVNIYGISSSKLSKTIKTRDEDYYGSINLNLSSVTCPMLVQLISNDDNENLIVEHKADKDGIVIFEYLAPGKYKVKIIYDENGNGKWDAGSYQDKYQPEKVAYVNEVQKIRSNWTEEINWDLKVDLTYTKNIRDYELEEQQRKEAEEKARKERENPQREQLQNNMIQRG